MMSKTAAIELLAQYLPPDRLYQVVQALAPDMLANGLQVDASEPWLEDCPHCGQSHLAGTIALCPLNPNRQKTQEHTLYWHPSEMYTARLAYGNDTPLWGSERLEVWHEGRWIAGKVGYLVPGGGLVLFPHGENYLEYITLIVGSRVRNVTAPVGDGEGPEH